MVDADSLPGRSNSEYGVDLYWLPLGAGGHSVRLNGIAYEALIAGLQRRRPCDLYHSALEVRAPSGRFVIEMTPLRAGEGTEADIVAFGAVGSRWVGRFRIFRYEVRRWLDGYIPDVAESVDSPRQLSADPKTSQRVLDLVPQVPTPVWGRDEMRTGDMWNSNSLIAWLLIQSGIDGGSIRPPKGGRAPGWQAGLVVARRAIEVDSRPPEHPGQPALQDEDAPSAKLGDQLEAWLQSDQDKTLGGLIAAFGGKSFAILFVLLLGVPALPLPTGGATHVMEIIAGLLALELIAGRDEVWLPQRWHKLDLASPRNQRFIASLTRLIRRLERISRPRLRFLFNHNLSNRVFGLLVLAGSAGAFFAPPFTGLDTLPALGVVLLSVSVLLEDGLIALGAILVGVAGVVLEIVAGSLAVHGLSKLF